MQHDTPLCVVHSPYNVGSFSDFLTSLRLIVAQLSAEARALGINWVSYDRDAGPWPPALMASSWEIHDLWLERTEPLYQQLFGYHKDRAGSGILNTLEPEISGWAAV